MLGLRREEGYDALQCLVGIVGVQGSQAQMAGFGVRERLLDVYKRQSLSLDITTVAGADALYDRLVVLTVRELGPILKIGSSVALVDGGTEVVLDVAEYKLPSSTPRNFSIHWRHGGPGVMKGVASLPQDMRAALTAGMQPGR